MALRDTLNKNPGITTGATIVVVLVFIAAIVYSMKGPAIPSAEADASRKFFFSDDDGVSKFADKAEKLPPFDHNGKQAVRARIFTAGGKEFINHLERYTPEGKKAEELMNSKGALRADPTNAKAIMRNGMEVKAPGAKEWTKLSDSKSLEITQPKPPGGASAEGMEEVFP
jgi:hypothetical protein